MKYGHVYPPPLGNIGTKYPPPPQKKIYIPPPVWYDQLDVCLPDFAQASYAALVAQ